MNLQQFARNLRYLRRTKGMSQQTLGKKIFASRSLISDIERGHKEPTLKMAMEVCKCFQTDLTTITGTDMQKCA